LQGRPPIIYGRRRRNPVHLSASCLYNLTAYLDPEEGGNMFLRIVDIHLQGYMVVRAQEVHNPAITVNTKMI
jgi:hypothetical protein